MIYPDWWGSTPPTIETLTSWCETTQVELYMDSQLLAHKTFHAAAQHDGHQTAAVESRIDEAVAQAVINAADYRFWESRYGWSTGGIAAALGVPAGSLEPTGENSPNSNRK